MNFLTVEKSCIGKQSDADGIPCELSAKYSYAGNFPPSCDETAGYFVGHSSTLSIFALVTPQVTVLSVATQ